MTLDYPFLPTGSIWRFCKCRYQHQVKKCNDWSVWYVLKPLVLAVWRDGDRRIWNFLNGNSSSCQEMYLKAFSIICCKHENPEIEGMSSSVTWCHLSQQSEQDPKNWEATGVAEHWQICSMVNHLVKSSPNKPWRDQLRKGWGKWKLLLHTTVQMSDCHIDAICGLPTSGPWNRPFIF